MRAAEFWRGRLQTHGHTGWADQTIYAYDQLERLKLLREVLLHEKGERGNAIDFGCGTGDFSRLLIDLGYVVCGFDPFARPKLHSRFFSYANSFEEIPFAERSVNLALSVTALDHVLDNEELLSSLMLIRSLVRDDAVFFILEYGFDSTAQRNSLGVRNDYQALRMLSDWRDLLRRAGFEISSVRNAPHPTIAPSTGYVRYSSGAVVRAARIGERYPQLSPFYHWILRKRAAKILAESEHSVAQPHSSPLKLIRCIPIK